MLLILLIPLGIPAGLFAPNLVSVVKGRLNPIPEADIAPNDSPRVTFDHEPILVLRNFSSPTVRPQGRGFQPDATIRARPRRAPPGWTDRPEPPTSRSVPLEADPSVRPDPGEIPAQVDPMADPLKGGAPSLFLYPDLEEFQLDIFSGNVPTPGSFTQPPSIPEPGTVMLLGTGITGLALHRRIRALRR